jgi:hypothetical protein
LGVRDYQIVPQARPDAAPQGLPLSMRAINTF